MECTAEGRGEFSVLGGWGYGRSERGEWGFTGTCHRWPCNEGARQMDRKAFCETVAVERREIWTARVVAEGALQGNQAGWHWQAMEGVL